MLKPLHLCVLGDMAWVAIPFGSPVLLMAFKDRSPWVIPGSLLLGLLLSKVSVGAWSRLSRRNARFLNAGQRQVRYRWFCGQIFACLIALASGLPFPFWSAAMWCIMGVVLLMMLPALDEARSDICGAAPDPTVARSGGEIPR